MNRRVHLQMWIRLCGSKRKYRVSGTACRPYTSRVNHWPSTRHRSQVTCERCEASRMFQEAGR